MANQERRERQARKHTQSCSLCGYRFSKDRAQCPSCKHWNPPGTAGEDSTVLFSDIKKKSQPIPRLITGPWDLCFGKNSKNPLGGIPVTSVTLLGGSPGAGKSTIALQLLDAIAEITKREVLYIGTEEDKDEYLERAERLRARNLSLMRLHARGSDDDVANIIMKYKPSGVVVDSLAGWTDDPEIAVETCKRFKPYASDLRAPVICIHHVTKSENFAGFMALQHAVDILLTLYPVEYEKAPSELREMHVYKTRYGEANFSVYLKMTELGLVPSTNLTKEDDEEE